VSRGLDVFVCLCELGWTPIRSDDTRRAVYHHYLRCRTSSCVQEEGRVRSEMANVPYRWCRWGYTLLFRVNSCSLLSICIGIILPRWSAFMWITLSFFDTHHVLINLNRAVSGSEEAMVSGPYQVMSACMECSLCPYQPVYLFQITCLYSCTVQYFANCTCNSTDPKRR
jgi:hypothetical protein